jgi:hypothetical protein
VSITAGIRFDHAAPSSRNVDELDLEGNETGAVVKARARCFTWNTLHRGSAWR